VGAARAEPAGMTSLVELDDVAFVYAKAAESRGRVFGFPGLSFAIERGEIFGVIGPNSAGKTSLLRLLTRVLVPHRGEVRLDGRPLGTLRPWELAREVAVVPQEAPETTLGLQRQGSPGAVMTQFRGEHVTAPPPLDLPALFTP